MGVNISPKSFHQFRITGDRIDDIPWTQHSDTPSARACHSPRKLIAFNVEYDCKPLTPISEPNPDAFRVPKLKRQPEVSPSPADVRTLTEPARMARARRFDLPTSRVHTVAARTHCVPIAMETAS